MPLRILLPTSWFPSAAACRTSGGQATVSLLPTGNSLTSPDTFFCADLDPATPGLDTVYVADDSNGIMKYCYSTSTGTWVYEGNKGSGSNAYRGLTGEVLGGGSVLLFSTRKGGGGATGGGELVSLDDTTGFNGNIGITSGSFVLLATASNDTAFRGVALAPVSAVPEASTLLLFCAGATAGGGGAWQRLRRRSRKLR